MSSTMGQRALAQMASPPLVRARWKVMSWVQDLLGACVTYKLFIKIIIKKKRKKKRKLMIGFSNLIAKSRITRKT